MSAQIISFANARAQRLTVEQMRIQSKLYQVERDQLEGGAPRNLKQDLDVLEHLIYSAQHYLEQVRSRHLNGEQP